MSLSLTRFLPASRILARHRDTLSLLLAWCLALAFWQPFEALEDVLSLTALQHWAVFEPLEHQSTFVAIGFPLSIAVGAAHFYRIARRMGYMSRYAQRAARIWTLLLALTLTGNIDVFDTLLIACVLGAIAPLVRGAVTPRKAIKSGLWLTPALWLFGPGALMMMLTVVLAAPLWRATHFGATGRRRIFTACTLAFGSFALMSQFL
ncbi:hypothetical protein [Phytohalomonas tamaricis]|uniref:hypothetical protein n=1 Tax=Phytohalomonas tamaricis TaxID=2081032 RepID=UPI000D0B1BFD|nr:hypothetical protein [Phytohalomonas tamaricis]